MPSIQKIKINTIEVDLKTQNNMEMENCIQMDGQLLVLLLMENYKVFLD